MVANPELVTAENINLCLVFLWNYLGKVMTLDGHIDQWVGIFNFGQLGVTDMPREAILSMTRTSMDNFIYIMHKCFYLNMSWGQSFAYNTFKILLEEETR